MSAETGINEGRLSRLERGELPLSERDRERLGAFYECDAGELLGERGTPGA